MNRTNILFKKANKKNTINIVILIVTIIVLLTTIYMIFIRRYNYENNLVPKNDNIIEPIPNVNYPNWMKYILEQNITKIGFIRLSCGEKDYNSTLIEKSLTISDLKRIFSNLLNLKMKRKYQDSGSFQNCGDYLEIIYTIGEKKYDITIESGRILPVDDENLVTLLLEENMETEKPSYCDSEYYCAPYYLFELSSNIKLDEILKQY